MTTATMRDQLARYIPPNSTPIEHPRGLGVVYQYEQLNGKPSAIAYSGKRNKADWHFSFMRESQREARVREFFEALDRSVAYKAELKAIRTAPTTFKAGDVVYNSWGWEQTNIDFYRVERVTKNYVWLRELNSVLVPSDGYSSMAGLVVADVDHERANAELTKHYSCGSSISFKHGSGAAWDGKPLYCSWYA